MSVATGNKGEKAKKFQSLNINNIYQGSALKPLQKNIPQKHGLQSLGKVPTARRAPANLPSLKAEHSGNDPTINLVPAGHSASGGWSANSLKDEHGHDVVGKANKNELVPSNVANSQLHQTGGSKVLSSSSSGPGPSVPSQGSNQSQPLQAQAVQPQPPTSKATWGSSGSGPATNPNNKFLSQKSPLFGQEFPSLTGDSQAGQNATSGSTSPSPPPGAGGKAAADSKYGPGPSLRPQSFATWSFSGKHSSQSPSNSVEKEMGPDNKSYEHVRNNRNYPGTAASAGSSDSHSLKFDVGVNSPLLAQGAPAAYLGRKSTPQRSQLVNKTSQPNQNSSRPRDNLFQGSIIDSEKLKRMDDIDSNDDDWTRRDDSFDYNKRIDSDDDEDEDDLSLNERSDSNWAEQINFSSSSGGGRGHSEPRDNFKPNSSSFVRGGRAGGGGHRNESGGGKLPMESATHDHNHLSFLDDEDQRLSKKNEEVLKNIERARRRRAEEEQKYRVADDGLNQYNDTFPSANANNKRMNDHRGNFENGSGGLLKSSSAHSPFGRFDVGESDGYDSSEKVEGYEATSTASRKQPPSQQQSVPPRFKRHGVELHSYKRTSPPKERGAGEGQSDADAVRSSASRDSAESQPEISKDYGALFRQSSASNPRGNRQSQSGSDLDIRNDLRQSPSSSTLAELESSSKKLKETENDEGNNFSRGSGAGRHSANKKGAAQQQSRSSEEVSKHKNSKSSSGPETSKDQKQHKRESKNDRSGGQRGSGNQRGSGGGGKDQNAKTHDRKLQGENSKSGGGDRRDRRGGGGASQRKDQDETEAGQRSGNGRNNQTEENDTSGSAINENSFEVTTSDGFAGWFAPRGQPSRRGRGGINSSLSRTSAPSNKDGESDEKSGNPMEFNRKSQPRDTEWENADNSSDPSEEVRNKETNRRRGGDRSAGAGHSDNKSNQRNRSEKPRKQHGKKGSNDSEDKKATAIAEEDSNESASGQRNRNHRGERDRNNRNNQRLDEKESRNKANQANERGDRGDRRSGSGGIALNSERDTKQSSYERRQSKLPPRFAKQKEQNRLSGQSSAQEAWGMSDPSGRISEGNAHINSGVAWDHSVPPAASQQQFISCVPQTAGNLSGNVGGTGGNIDFEANRALLMQRFRNENLNAAASNESANTALLSIGGSGGGKGPNMEEVFNPTESRDNAVQTIIFENTNFKGKRPQAGSTAAGNSNSGNNVGNEKLMFKIASQADQAAKNLGFASKAEDDIKLDFTFDSSDISGVHSEDKAAGNTNTSAKAGTVVRPTSSSSAAAAAPAVVAAAVAAQPATADDLNMKIASVKKVWETLPSMSPPAVAAGGTSSGDQTTIGGPFSSTTAAANDDQAFDATATAATARYDKEGPTSNMAKVRPQQQPSQQAGNHPPQSQHHLQSPPSQTANVPSQSGHQSQVQQLHSQHQQVHQATHQGLLQQGLDADRLMGRSNQAANLTYNRLLGAASGGLPNLQSPPSILSQQPSLYQAFQIDPNRAVTNQLYPYPPTAAGMGGQSLILPPAAAGSSLSAAAGTGSGTSGDIFGSSNSNQFGRQFAGPPPGSNQVSSAMNNVLMSQSSLMSSAMKPSVAASGIGPIGTKGAYQQGSLGSLPPGSGTSPLLIPYDGGYVQNIQRSAAAGQTAFYQALAASSQQAASRQNNYGITGFPGQNSLVQQQLLRNHAPHPMNNPYMKNDSGGAGAGGGLKASSVAQQLASGLQTTRQFSTNNAGLQPPNGQSQPSIKGTATSLASMSLRNSVLGTGATVVANGATVTSAPTGQQTVTSYSPTPIQRPPGGKGKASLEASEDSPTVLDVPAGSKEKKLSDVED